MLCYIHECYEEEVQPYRKTGCKPIIIIVMYVINNNCKKISNITVFFIHLKLNIFFKPILIRVLINVYVRLY